MPTADYPTEPVVLRELNLREALDRKSVRRVVRKSGVDEGTIR